MCKLCNKIYRCSESRPYLGGHIQLDPEGVFQLMNPWYDIISETNGYISMSIKFCPECGNNLRESGLITLNESRAKRDTKQ